MDYFYQSKIEQFRGIHRILKRGVKFGIPHGNYIFVIKDVKIAKIDNQEMHGENAKFCTF